MVLNHDELYFEDDNSLFLQPFAETNDELIFK